MRSTRLKAALVVAVAVVGMIAATGSATPIDHRDWRACGDKRGQGAGWYNVRAQHVSCDDARAVARRWWNKGGGPRRVRVDGVTYRCRDKQVGYEVVRVRCNADDERRVRFKAGS